VLGPLTGSSSLDDAHARPLGEAAGDQAGYALPAAGDVDADGYSDILIGAPCYSGTLDGAGAAYVVFGSSL